VIVFELRDVYVVYGYVDVLWGMFFIVEDGEIVVLFGNNGVGKMMMLVIVLGVVWVCSGFVYVFGEDIMCVMVWDVVGCGVVYVLEGWCVFLWFSVYENF